MKDAVELFGWMAGREGDKYNLVPSGNHRNQQRVQCQPAPPSQPGQVCPRCKGKLRLWVQTFPTKEYTAWAEQAAKAILQKYQAGQFDGPVVVYLWVFGGRGFIESRDWDNVQKCVGDVLVDTGVLPKPPPAKKGDEPKDGTDDVRSIKGWRTWYLTRAEHVAITGGAAGKPDNIRARLFVQIVPAQEVEPFRL